MQMNKKVHYKGRKTKKLSIRWKILIPVTLIFIIGCVNIGYYAVNSYNEELKKTAIKQAEIACDIAVAAINAEEIDALGPGDENTKIYENNIVALKEVAENCGIKYLYTIYEENGKLYYGLDIDESANKYHIGDVYDGDTYKVLEPVLKGNVIKSHDIDNTSEGEYLLTVYKPIYDNEGTVIGIMGCDYDAEHVITSRTTIITSLVMVLIATLLFDIGLINFIVGKTMKNINMVEATLYDLVHKDGDLTQKLIIKTGDECELIAEDINVLLEYIKCVVVNIAKNSFDLDVSADEVVTDVAMAEDKITDITSVIEELSAAMEETSASLNQVNDSIADITHSVDEIAKDASDGSESSELVMVEAENIFKTAEEKRQQVLIQVRSMSESLNEKIKKSRSVEKIHALTDDIIKITEQTTLLSLNASIEAARAGESGRGFAVVADEIGKLASSSSEAAVEIQKVNEEVLSSVNDLAKESERMLNFIESVTISGYDSLLGTSKNYEENISKLNDMLLDFSAKCKTLECNISNINEMANAVNIAIEESTLGILHITENSADLSRGVSNISCKARENKNISQKLSVEVNKFKV